MLLYHIVILDFNRVFIFFAAFLGAFCKKTIERLIFLLPFGLYLANVRCGSHGHFVLKYLGKVLRIAKATAKGNVTYGGKSPINQRAGVLNSHCVTVIRNADVQAIFEKRRKILFVVGKRVADGIKRKRGIGKVVVDILFYRKGHLIVGG